MVQAYCVMMATYGSRMSMISVYSNHDHQYWVPSVKTRLWNSSEEIIPGLVIGCSLKTIVSHVRLALDPRHHVTGRTDFFDNSRSRKNHGIQFQSILLISYHPPQDIPQYW